MRGAAEGKTIEDPPGGTRHLVNSNKRVTISAADKKDRVMGLEKENIVLKEKENLLQSEIQKMETKLRRIEGLARSRSKYMGEESGNYYDF